MAYSTVANPYDTKQLSSGSHSITASISLSSGGTTTITANFTVNNSMATATTAPTATPQASYSNQFSKSSDRSNASALNGQTVSGNIYAFASPESGASRVDFYLDNTSGSGTPYRTEGNAPCGHQRRHHHRGDCL